jgi:hypothetical protein
VQECECEGRTDGLEISVRRRGAGQGKSVCLSRFGGEERAAIAACRCGRDMPEGDAGEG